MCFKRKTQAMSPTQRRLLTFGKNKYGGGHDLNGCVNDSNNIAKKFSSLWPDMDIRKYLDNEVTVDNYKAKVSEAIATLSPGATVLLICDSCFSGTVTRAFGCMEEERPVKNRFFDPGIPHREKTRIKAFVGSGDIKWLVISGCSENQTSADCYEGGQYVGALTYFLLNPLKKGMTYMEWFKELRKYLPSQRYEQAPTLEGPDYLYNKQICEGETLIIHNSSHGSYTFDTNGDEADGKDEGIYFDRLLVDDEINAILQKIPNEKTIKTVNTKPVIPPPPKPPIKK